MKIHKKYLTLTMCLLSVFIRTARGKTDNRGDTIDKKVKTLVSRMTLPEKIGQMTQISLEFVSTGYPETQRPLSLDKEKLRRVLLEYHVGSILNVGTQAHTIDLWHDIITEIQDIAVTESRLGIPVLYGIDAIHGATYTIGATLFPQSIGMAAARNPHLVKECAAITAYEVRASGIPWNFNPVLGVGRNPAWPRLWETFGEDPYLVSVMGYAYIKGLEGENNDISHPHRIAACMKHYLGYSYPLTGQDRTPAWIPERMLREYFLPPFKSAIEAGVRTVMVNSSEINGIPVHSSEFYLKKLLFDELGFDGFVVSDWQDIENLHTRECVAASPKEAVKMAVMAGIDMSMVPLDLDFCKYLLELVKEGEVPESRLDEAVSRILKVKFLLGLFDNPYPHTGLEKKFACEEFRKINLQAARESITLLENRNSFLPLPKNMKILVTGPAADKLSFLNSGWTITWQGDREDLYPQKKHTILEAITEKIGEKNVTFTTGINKSDIEETVKSAVGKDAVILCLGEKPYCETPGNISDLSLSRAQLNLAKALYQTGVPVVLIMVEGRPRIIREITDKAQAIVMAYLPGMEGGQAIADVLFGDFNPGGRLPITYPKYPNDFTLYDHKLSENSNPNCTYDPQWPFGYGLSYTTFDYSGLQTDKKIMHPGGEITVYVTITNTGKRAGLETVQMYIRDCYASVTPSVKRLKGFEKIDLNPGESRCVIFTINEEMLSFIGRNNRPVVEPGEFKIFIGGLEGSFNYIK